MNAKTSNPLSLRAPGRHRVRGVGLIEVLVAVAILAFGLLGIAALQATALRNSQSSYERSQAVASTYTILDRMRANRSAAIGPSYAYNIAKTCDVPAGGGQAANDLRDWITDLHKSMADEKSCGTIVCNQPGTTFECTITVEWDDSRGTQGIAKQTLTTSTAI